MSQSTSPNTSRHTPVTLANWRTAGATASAFRTVPDFIPTQRIAADPAARSDLPEAPTADFGAFDVALAADKHFDLPALLATSATDAFLVVHDGRIVHETYGNGLDVKTPHILMSMSKAITGLIASTLAEAGTLDVEAPVATLIPEIAETSYRDATIRHLLDMRAGAAFDSATLAAYAAATGWDALPPDAPPADLKAFFAGMAHVPGTHGGVFKYDSANTDLLGLVLERATGKSYARLVSETLWQPMGATHDAFITVDSKGAARCSGGIGATGRDVARLGQLVLDEGRRDTRQIVPASVIADLWSGGDTGAWSAGQFGASFNAMGLGTTRYRNGWYVVDGPPRMLFAMGIHGQNLFVMPDHRLVIVKLSSLVAPIDPPAIMLAHRAVPEIARLLGRNEVADYVPGGSSGEDIVTEDLTPKFRTVHPAFPAEHMRIIGEICVYWSAMEQCTLQAVCEAAKIGEYAGIYLGSNIPAGTRFDMLQAVANALKEEDHLREKGKNLLKLIEGVRQAYLLRNKYAHAHIRTNGPDKDPEIHFSQVAKKMKLENRLLPLSELKADADAIFEACEALIHYLQQHGFCEKAWS